MIEIRKIDLPTAEKYSKELMECLYICLVDNIPNVVYFDAQKYFDNMHKYIADGSAIVVGAFDETKFLGFQWAYEVEVSGERRLHSSFSCVLPEWQGKGIGTHMMKEIEKDALSKGINVIEAMCTARNKRAVNYHLHNGFEIERYKVVKRMKEEDL